MPSLAVRRQFLLSKKRLHEELVFVSLVCIIGGDCTAMQGLSAKEHCPSVFLSTGSLGIPFFHYALILLSRYDVCMCSLQRYPDIRPSYRHLLDPGH